MDNFIIVCPGDKIEEVKKAIKEKLPDLELKIYTEQHEEVIDVEEGLIQQAVEEVLKRLRKKKPIEPVEIPDPIIDPITSKPWPRIPENPTILMYGCIPTNFHTIPQAEEKLKTYTQANAALTGVVNVPATDAIIDESDQGPLACDSE